ncbi:hypothetical protein ccbrp13_24990 [Ktedonobacteria bacterium brp13]|nr:hypothetical protein ccbrp13_24990 [Ktedonobacteria bacterium brp13]
MLLPIGEPRGTHITQFSKMDKLLKTAIIGTTQASNQQTEQAAQINTGTGVDTLSSQLDAAERERSFLLTAGALAIYQQAGQLTSKREYPIEQAPLEQLPACNDQVTHLLRELFLQHANDLLPEALQRLQARHQRLPYNLLTLALQSGTTNKALGRSLLALLGERGHWLARYNPDWKWALTHRADENASAETIWQEGIFTQRIEVLQRLRENQPAQARAWLAAAWSKEAAAERLILLDTLHSGLSMDDVPFLIQQLTDRSPQVRKRSAELLVTLPETTQAQLLMQRADEMLDYQPHTLQHGEILVTLPVMAGGRPADEQWCKDVDIAGSLGKKSKAEQWFNLAISAIPPQHWEQRFHVNVEELLAALEGDPYEVTLIKNWTRAAGLHATTAWQLPLLRWHLAQLLVEQKKRIYGQEEEDYELTRQLLGRAEPSTIEQLLWEAQKKQDFDQLWLLFSLLPGIWSPPVSQVYIQLIFQYTSANNDPHFGSSLTTLLHAQNALHPDCFALIIQEQEAHAQTDSDYIHKDYYQIRYVESRNKCIKHIKLRKRIQEEI